ncbi:MAG: glycosyltransferase family 4 protein [Chloroflexota bacterium]|jgi:glycosyltransferase involved in cell wall biosynthesis
MSLKIGLVTGEYPPMEGGVGAFTRELARALGDLGHQVHIVTDRRARPQEAPRDFWNPRDPVETDAGQLHARVNRWWWSANNAAVDVAMRYDLDVVNIQYQAAAYDMRVPAINFLPWRLRGVTRSVVTFHDLRYPYLFPKAGKLRQWVVKHLARTAGGVIATNEEDGRRLRAAGIPADRLRQIPIGSNITVQATSGERVQDVRRELGLQHGDSLLGYFGFINASKGADLLLAALAELPERFKLVFVGGKTGSSDAANEAYLQQIESMIESKGLARRVHWSGFLDDAALAAHFQACDLMVMPYRDGVSLRRGTLMAILAHGRPLLTSPPEGSGAPLVHGQNVWMTPVDDPELLSDAIRQVAGDDSLRRRLSAGAREVSGQFRWERIAVETAAFYRALGAGDVGAGDGDAF